MANLRSIMSNMFLYLLLSLFLGCSSLHIREDDSTGFAVAKGVARVPIAIVTFGMSELWHKNERSMESWLGHHKSELVAAWGAPNLTTSTGNGGEALTYNNMWKPNYIRSFTTNASGVIESYSWSGN